MRLGSLLGDRLANSAGYRPEIQALRALAVMMVVIYHLWPSRLPGGYAGVDVFFVISGFLITGHLWTSASQSRLSLRGFYARRIRRLAPASLFVLVVVLAATAAVAPFGQWPAYTTEIIGSALFAENWVLAGASVDYLAAESAASPVQHYWSLSVEEQFYLVWPLLILLTGLALRRSATRTRARGALLVLCAIFAASLAFSIVFSHTDPAPAYFVTPTRVWQFAAGGILALAEPAGIVGRRLRSAITAPIAALASSAGFAAIAATAFLLDARAIDYPGAWALIPVIPTVAVIAAGTGGDRWFSPRRLYDLAPVQFLGTLSYPIYLWHWPLIVLAPFVLGELTLPLKVAVLGATLILAALTTLFIENPIRFNARLTARRALTPVLAAATALMLIVAPSVGLGAVANDRIAREKAQALDRIFRGDKCYGALVMQNPGNCDSIEGQASPAAISAAATDKPQPFADGCIDPLNDHTGVYCDYGDVDVEPSLLVWGDSHAAAWGGAFDLAGQAGDTHVVIGSRQGCPATLTAPVATVFRDMSAEERDNCDARNEQMLDLVKSTSSIHTVVLASFSSNYIYGPDPSSPDYYAGTIGLIEELNGLGVTVKLLGDVPLTGRDAAHRIDVPDCLAKNLSSPVACSNPRSVALATTSLREAIARSPALGHVSIIDTSTQFCDDARCYAMIGGVPGFFDASHVTDSYSRSMGPWVLDNVVAERPAPSAAPARPESGQAQR